VCGGQENYANVAEDFPFSLVGVCIRVYIYIYILCVGATTRGKTIAYNLLFATPWNSLIGQWNCGIVCWPVDKIPRAVGPE